MNAAMQRLRYAWVWMRLDLALVIIPRDLREVTLETWRDRATWQLRQNELQRRGK